MATPGVETSTIEVLDQIVTQLATLDGLNTSNVFISAVEVFLGDSYPGDQYVEVVPGACLDRYAKQGFGFVEDQVRIAVFKRLMTDQENQDTQRLIHATSGLLQLVDLIDGKLIQNFLQGKLTVPLYPVQREAAQRTPIEGSGWCSITRVYSMKYRTVFPDPQSLTS